MTLSLKTTSYTAAAFMVLMLGFLLLLGSRQYRSNKEYEAVIEQNEKIIFRFATIREHITESLLENRPQQLNSITDEIEGLNGNITQVLQQPIIPNEYRLSFAGQVDLAGIVLLLKNIGTGEQSPAKTRQLNQEIRVLGERLMLFDRVIVEHVKRKLVGFQNFVIGLLAVALIVVIYFLLFWHGRIGMPLIDLAKQAKNITLGRRTALTLREKSGDVAELAGAFQAVLAKQQDASNELARYSRILSMIHSIREAAHSARTRDEIFSNTCRGILTNSDYVLAWIGIPGDNNRIIPATADGSTTMSRLEQDECMTALLNAAEENSERYDVAHKAFEQKTPVVKRAILEGLPKGPFKNTPFADKMPDCMALPLIRDRKVYGVMSIYSIASPNFTEEEIELLKSLGREIVFAIFSLEARESDRTMAYLQAVREQIYENSPDLIMAMQTDGTILEANPAAERKLRHHSRSIIGANFYDIFHNTAKSSGHFRKQLRAGAVITLELRSTETEYLVSFFPLEKITEKNILLVIARDVSEQKSYNSDVVRAAKLAAMGEISVGVANEINNLTNGLINYTQILDDEIKIAAVPDNDQASALLNNIITEGERISKTVQQLLYFNNGHPRTREVLKINKIAEDSLALMRHQFRYDAIKVALNFPDNTPSVQGNVQEMQYIFLNLLSNARYALNQRYQGKNPQKCLEIKGEVVARNGQSRMKVVCTDFGAGIPPNIINRVFEPFFSTKPEGIGTGLGLSICRKILEENNGTLEIESIPEDHTSIIMELPIAV